MKTRTPPRRTEAERNALVLQFRTLPGYIATRMLRDACRADRDDAAGVGTLALVRAAETFDADLGPSFMSYAFAAVRLQILKYLGQNAGVIRVPDSLRNPVVGDRTRADTARARCVFPMPPDWDRARPERTDAPRFDELALLRAAVARLAPRTQRVLAARFAEGLLLREVGAELGLTKERVRQIERNGLAALRKRLGPVNSH